MTDSDLEAYIRPVAEERDRLRRALAWMVEDATNSQRPGGGDPVPFWIRRALQEIQ